MSEKNLWVSGNRKDGYKVKTEGASRAASVHETQAEAIKAAKEIAKGRGAEVIVQRPNGTIRSKDSYGPDPNPPKSREH